MARVGAGKVTHHAPCHDSIDELENSFSSSRHRMSWSKKSSYERWTICLRTEALCYNCELAFGLVKEPLRQVELCWLNGVTYPESSLSIILTLLCPNIISTILLMASCPIPSSAPWSALATAQASPLPLFMKNFPFSGDVFSSETQEKPFICPISDKPALTLFDVLLAIETGSFFVHSIVLALSSTGGLQGV
nr:hypothetical protein L204_03625 [Cryptococcus depauperatus CBS 7855]